MYLRHFNYIFVNKFRIFNAFRYAHHTIRKRPQTSYSCEFYSYIMPYKHNYTYFCANKISELSVIALTEKLPCNPIILKCSIPHTLSCKFNLYTFGNNTNIYNNKFGTPFEQRNKLILLKHVLVTRIRDIIKKKFVISTFINKIAIH